jgi:hypothetical protein
LEALESGREQGGAHEEGFDEKEGCHSVSGRGWPGLVFGGLGEARTEVRPWG